MLEDFPSMSRHSCPPVFRPHSGHGIQKNPVNAA
jgi:hypothetical protein